MKKPLIEKYITYLRVAEEQARARITQEERLSLGGVGFNLHLLEAYGMTYTRMAERAAKYHLAASAQAMIEALRPRPLLLDEMSLSIIDAIAGHTRELDPDIPTPIMRLPDGPIWLELAEPLSVNTGWIAAMFFTSSDYEVERLLEQPQTPTMRRVLEASGRPPGAEYKWQLHFIDTDGTPTSHYRYKEQSQVWEIVPGAEPCPTDECIEESDISDLTGKGETYIIPCNFCATLMAHWRSWLVTALLCVQGEFAATEERQWPQHEEQATRKVKRKKSGKYDEILIKHNYYSVNFDASVKPEYKSGAAKESTEHTSWVADAQAINPESVIYVKHSFGQGERKLDPANNPRWKVKQTVTVKSHERSIPMRVETLQKRITRVIASAYEQGRPI